MKQGLNATPPSTVVIMDDAGERGQLLVLCRELGLNVCGWTDSGNAGMDMIEALPLPPDLVITSLQLQDMDGADLILALSLLERDFGLVICGGDPRLQDTAMMLASTLGLSASAALQTPVTPVALRAAIASCGYARLPPVPPISPASTEPPGSPVSPVAEPWHAAPAAPSMDPAEIHRGLLRKEFQLHYQPKIALAGRQLLGAEALLRWPHPRHGMLTPDSFLHQAEAAGLTGLLTMTVLHAALADMQSWQAAGMRLPVAINLSPLSLTDPHLASLLIDTVHSAGVPPSCITFEITEHNEIADLGAALRILLKLRLQGFGLSLDDYGAGHGSMLQLSRIPFTEVKLDRRLVHDAWKRPHLRPLLQHTIDSAHELGVPSVAEGIETREDWDFMQSLGCDAAQGYLIARPMPAPLLLAWRPHAA
jgi:EAL domain-containing protein (putative c-di-GMP-specific phosphodiesterase class I)